MHSRPVKKRDSVAVSLFLGNGDVFVLLTLSHLSEPVDGVKEQSTEKLFLGFWQAFNFVHYIHVCQDQRTPCGGKNKYKNAQDEMVLQLW